MRIYFESTPYLKLWRYVDSMATEIGGMGYANFLEDGNILVKDVFLLPQLVSKSEVDFEETGGDAYAVEKAFQDNVLGDPSFVWLSWHSHNSMNVFWSPTDDARIAALRATGIQHALSMVVNHDHRIKARYDAYDVEHHGASIPHITMDDLAVLLDPVDPIMAECQAEIDKLVTVIVPKPTVYGSGSYQGGYQSTTKNVTTWKEGQKVDKPAPKSLSPADDDDEDEGEEFVVEPRELEDGGFTIGPDDEVLDTPHAF